MCLLVLSVPVNGRLGPLDGIRRVAPVGILPRGLDVEVGAGARGNVKLAIRPRVEVVLDKREGLGALELPLKKGRVALQNGAGAMRVLDVVFGDNVELADDFGSQRAG